MSETERGGVERSAAERSATERVAAASRDDRAYLLAVAHRILADPAEAEDVVQDAFVRLATQEVGEIRDLRGWLVVVVRRLALDRIGSAHGRLSAPHDPTAWGFDAAADALDPADRVTLDDEIRRALSVVLERLTPGERAAFLLHDVFGIPFDSVAEMVGRTAAACRQLASRARRAIRESGPTSDAPPADPELQDVVDRFIAACAGGDLDALVRTLHPDVSGWATLGGERVGFDVGAERVAAGSLRYLGPQSGWSLAPLALDDGMAVVATRGGDPVALIRLQITDGLIAAIHTVLLR
ncbi:sigma-70 family RNA polymerase sigma factor [Antribacter sp. KLBMP9083]|uniref:Sigma-70 family RNA polymerase sigma factor n=1 Tax=Antribacter soli TaxID=2910976 RepID=A0AA41QJ78_9MICO|nr:sigma-70 family RNA polymerase sigma factor [Antribacter soli]MCF4123114.1 sigma-70 family RNA polymerase sigma factor [Antribacter soli]